MSVAGRNAKELKVWNGRGESGGWRGVDQAYVCATSKADAVRLLKQAGHRYMSAHELNVYWSGCWGRPMEGIERERGVWVQRERNSQVERVI